jgi:hypothetical protein
MSASLLSLWALTESFLLIFTVYKHKALFRQKLPLRTMKASLLDYPTSSKTYKTRTIFALLVPTLGVSAEPKRSKVILHFSAIPASVLR